MSSTLKFALLTGGIAAACLTLVSGVGVAGMGATMTNFLMGTGLIAAFALLVTAAAMAPPMPVRVQRPVSLVPAYGFWGRGRALSHARHFEPAQSSSVPNGARVILPSGGPARVVSERPGAGSSSSSSSIRIVPRRP